MDFKKSIRPLVDYWWLVLLSVVIVVAALVIIDKSQSAEYEGTMTLIVKQTMPVSDDSGYKYDGYYAVMANQTFADTLESWLKSPEMVAEIYEKAKIAYPKNMSALRGRFDVEKVISQSVAVGVKTGSGQETEDLLNATNEVMKSRIEGMLVDKDGKPLFTLNRSNVLVLPYVIDYRLQFGVGIMGAICVGIFLAYLMSAISKEK
ncbi:MAG: hypothetical protein ACOZAR_04220 [Patescibacteria group bacterium]